MDQVDQENTSVEFDPQFMFRMRDGRLFESRAAPLYLPGMNVRSYQCGELGDVSLDSEEWANALPIVHLRFVSLHSHLWKV